MKHYLLATLLLAATLTTGAATYDYLVFETSDGTQLSMTADGLKMVYNDGILTVTNGSVTQTFPTSALSRMFFSNTKQGDDATAISMATADDLNDSETCIYDLSGRLIAPRTSNLETTNLRPGLYIFKKGNTTTKKIVK